MTKRAKIGDVLEIPTSKGLAYAQYTHRYKSYGALIRVLDGIFGSRPKDFTALVKKKHKYVTFFPVGAAVNRGIFEVVAQEEVPEFAKELPIFRSGIVDPKTGKVETWWFWDGEKEWKVGKLSAQQRSLPIRGVWTAVTLVHRIESGWTPETDPTT